MRPLEFVDELARICGRTFNAAWLGFITMLVCLLFALFFGVITILCAIFTLACVLAAPFVGILSIIVYFLVEGN